MEYDFADDSNFDRFLADRSPVTTRSIVSLSRADRSRITETLRRTLSDLDRFYCIEKASLALFDRARRRLCITHLYVNGAFKTSLTLVLPDRRSLLHQIHSQGFPVADNCPSLLTTSVIEKKILMGPSTRSALISPLTCDGIKLGLINLASMKEAAFSAYLDGIGENIVSRFASEIRTLLAVPVDAGQ